MELIYTSQGGLTLQSEAPLSRRLSLKYLLTTLFLEEDKTEPNWIREKRKSHVLLKSPQTALKVDVTLIAKVSYKL